MFEPKKQSSDLFGRLELLHTNLLEAESVVSLWLVNKKATPRRLEIVRSVMRALTIVWTCRELQTIDFGFAEEIHSLCRNVRFRVGQDDATEVLEIAIRCDELSEQILADLPIGFALTSDGKKQVSDRPCKTSSFCKIFGCMGDCGRSVQDDN